MNKFEAQRKLCIVWFGNAGTVGLLFVIFTLLGRFGDKASDAWQWFSQVVTPTLTLMLGTFAASAGHSTASVVIDGFYFKLAFYTSWFYFLVIYLSILMVPFAFKQNETSFNELLNNTKLYLNIIQGVVAFSLGLFFNKQPFQERKSKKLNITEPKH